MATRLAVIDFREERLMDLEYVLGGILSVLLMGYLVYALLWPERF
jgi:K+-transporting ATPase KdpF subunit